MELTIGGCVIHKSRLKNAYASYGRVDITSIICTICRESTCMFHGTTDILDASEEIDDVICEYWRLDIDAGVY